jgi:hypothetical protein
MYVSGLRNIITAVEMENNYTSGFFDRGNGNEFTGCVSDSNGYVQRDANASSRPASGFVLKGAGGVYVGDKVTSYRAGCRMGISQRSGRTLLRTHTRQLSTSAMTVQTDRHRRSQVHHLAYSPRFGEGRVHQVAWTICRDRLLFHKGQLFRSCACNGGAIHLKTACSAMRSE